MGWRTSIRLLANRWLLMPSGASVCFRYRMPNANHEPNQQEDKKLFVLLISRIDPAVTITICLQESMLFLFDTTRQIRTPIEWVLGG